MSLQVIHRLNTHRVWANRRLLDVASSLSPAELDQHFELGQGSLRATLRDLHVTEEFWYVRLARKRDLKIEEIPEIDDLAELREQWHSWSARWAEYLRRLDPEDLHRAIHGTTIRGYPFSMSVLDSLLHLFNLQVYHHTQAINMLRQLSASPPDLTLAQMTREEQAAKAH